QRTAVYLKKKSNLQSLLNEDEDFFLILSVLSPEQCTELCSTMNDYLLGKINDGRPDLTRLLEPLSLEQCTVVFKAIKDSILPELHSVNFNYLLQHLSPVQGTAFCRAIKNNLSTMGIEIRDFSIILEGLPIDKYIVVFIELK